MKTSTRCLVVLLLCCVLSVEGRPSSAFALAKDERTVNTAEVLNLQKRKEIGKQDDGQSFSGSFDFVTDDGEAFEIMYEASRRGFLPKGEHLAVAPALPYHRV
ncbi:pupal cuticle protein 27-like [Oratosquilla oratoria]|uniref:pupal cuticle protein 27-like n=1 Tax=Oratosquilla oratoria TaxID=337810 RepID=UPI003F759C45